MSDQPLICDSVLPLITGAPTASIKGNYMWVECKPDGMNANCLTKKGPSIPLDGQPTRLPPSAAKDM